MRTAIAALAFLACGAGAAAATTQDPVIAIRGSDTITLSQARALIAAADPQVRAKLSDPAAMQAFIRNALLARAVIEAAHAANWERKPDIAALLARTREAAIAQSFLASKAAPPASYPSTAELDAFYDKAKPQLMQPRAYHLVQDFVTLSADAAPAEIERAKHALAAARDNFAAPHPAKPPAPIQTLDLGWLAENRLQPDARDAVAGLLEGQVTPTPVCTKTGCALLKLVATRPAGPAPLADVRDSLIRLMRQQKERDGEQAYANTLLTQSPVRIDEIQLSHLAGQ